MSVTLSGAACPMPPTTTVETVSTNKSDGAFRNRRAEREDVCKWWEHSITVEVEFCQPQSSAGLDRARRLMGHLNPHYARFDLQASRAKSDHVFELEIKGGYTTREKTSAQVKEMVEGAIARYLGSSLKNDLVSAKFDLESEQKQKVKRYDVWDGVDRMA